MAAGCDRGQTGGLAVDRTARELPRGRNGDTSSLAFRVWSLDAVGGRCVCARVYERGMEKGRLYDGFDLIIMMCDCDPALQLAVFRVADVVVKKYLLLHIANINCTIVFYQTIVFEIQYRYKHSCYASHILYTKRF